MMIVLKIIWALIMLFVVFCMIQSLRYGFKPSTATDKYDKLKEDFDMLKWICAGFIGLSISYMIAEVLA